MKILLTGGTGLIGSEFYRQFSPEAEITILTRNETRAKKVLGQATKTLTNIESLTHLDDFDAVINLAGEPIANKKWTEKQKEEICQSRWFITKRLSWLFSQSQQPPAVFISGSAVGMYGRQDSSPITESHTHFHHEFSHTICKRWEELAMRSQPYTRVCILRTGIVLSPNGGALAKMLPAFRLGLGGKLAGGQQYMPWIHIDDMVSLIILLLTKNQCDGVYNAVSPHCVPNGEFTQSLGHAVHRPAFLPMPSFVLKLLFGEMSQLLIYGQNVKPARILEAGFEFKHPELDEALKSLL